MIEKYSCNVQLCRYETRQIVYNSHVIYTISDPMKWKKIETVVHSNGIFSMLFMPKCFALLKECALTIRKTWYKLYKYDGQWNHVCTKVTMQSSMFFFWSYMSYILFSKSKMQNNFKHIDLLLTDMLCCTKCKNSA